MRCPLCGAAGFTPPTFLENVRAQVWKIVGLVAAVSVALAGQAELLGEPTRHIVTVAGIVCSTIISWNIKSQGEQKP